ncbi:Gfo/Idh/MocA family oxidoreductase [Microbacterium sp. W1N]|uniref:Gfo/Idh/MocA family protein n=1 Tax=Microbacterium festucae TaxID=2977531 RepID=UPI0021C0F50B|nr:Gfo/Idh/MocA family oxidoreductase [Microbacterium festucae]MCT9820879.1 Gfo/Idh/MocA family oxidoreductase [Microbacterium festucae]
MSTDGPVRIGLAGVHGHGRTHVEAALALQRDGRAEIVAVADPRGPGDVPDGVAHFTAAEEMIAAGGLDIVVLSTPIPSHAALAEAALEAGAHVMLEKPPVVSVAAHERLLAVSARTGRAVQVGFQSLASDGVAATAAAAAGIGEIRHIAAVGVWSRSEEYWRRARWSGRRVLDGQVMADGVVTNPLAHAVATALVIAGARGAADVAAVETDLRRANDIDADDTSTVRVRLTGGPDVVAALATTGERRHEPFVLVRGTGGHLIYHYTLDVLSVFADDRPLPRTFHFARTGVLDDLVRHAADGTAVRVPLDATGAFTRVLEEVVAAPAPTAIERFEVHERAGERYRVVPGIGAAMERAAWDGLLLREFDSGIG